MVQFDFEKDEKLEVKFERERRGGMAMEAWERIREQMKRRKEKKKMPRGSVHAWALQFFTTTRIFVFENGLNKK